MTRTSRNIALALLGAILVAGGGAAGYLFLPSVLGSEVKSDNESATTYYCPMHPHVEKDEPGICPICEMDLVPKGVEGAESAHDHAGHSEDAVTIEITPRQRVLANIRSAEVDYRLMDRSIQAPATVEFNEATQKAVTAWFPGRIERLLVDKTGEYVRKGQPVAHIFSPKLIAAQKEYLISLRTRDRQILPSFGGSGDSMGDSLDRGDQLVEASRRQLELLGMSENQINALEERGDIAMTTTIHSTASGLVTRRSVVEGGYVMEGTKLFEVVDPSSIWIIANIQQTDAVNLRPGMRVSVTGNGLGARTLTGHIDHIYPTVDRSSRTVQVRAVISNKGSTLKPGMYLTATIQIESRDVLAVPVRSVIRTGKRDLVYVEVDDNTFEAREVELGRRSGGYVEVRSGNLGRGDKIAAEGGYLLDSERQLGMTGGGAHTHD